MIIINIHNLELIFITNIAYFLSHAFPDRPQSTLRHFTKGRAQQAGMQKKRTTPDEIPRRAYGKRPATVTSIGTRSRIYCNPSGVEYSRKILKVLKRWCGAFRVPGSSGSTELRGESALSLRSGHRSSGTADIVRTFLQGMPQRANHPSSPPWKPVRLHPVYRKSRERLFNWTRSTIIEERRGKKSLDIPLLAALLIPRPSDRGNFPPRGICGEESFFVNALHEKRSSCLHSF